MIQVNNLIDLFTLMYKEHWKYEWGAASKGTVDCSGAFVYAYKYFNEKTPQHTSNAIARFNVGELSEKPSPGYAAFKWRSDSAGKTPERWKDGRGDYYHIGLVDKDNEHVLNAKGSNYGFCRETISAWGKKTTAYYAPLLIVNYGEEQKMEPYHAVVTTESGSLNMRSGPGTEHQIMFKIPKGTPVLVLMEHPNGWAFVDEDGTQGYVSMKYLTRVDEPVEEPKEYSWGVYIPCDNEAEARRYAGNIKGAIVLRKEEV